MWQVKGKVVQGDNYGRTIGFPTANIDRRQYRRLGLQIRHGVYAGTATLPSGREYLAGIVVGPNDNKGLPRLEAYLIGFKGNLYGKNLIFTLKKYLRTFKKFSTERQLKQQIKQDIQTIKKLTWVNWKTGVPI